MANESFIFYESWYEFIDDLDREDAKELVYQIYRVGSDKPMDTDDKMIQKLVKSFILPNIKGAQRRYRTAVANGKKSDGAPRKTTPEEDNLIWELHLEGLTYDEIVERCDTYGFRVSKNTVGSRIRERKKKEEELKTNNQNQEPRTETKNGTNTTTFITNSISNFNEDREEELETDSEAENEPEKEQPLHYTF